MAHSSVVGGSTASRVMACPPSRVLAQGVPERPGSEHSRRGTALHTLIEVAISTAAPPEQFGAAIGSVIEGHAVTEKDVTDALLPAYLAFREQYQWRVPDDGVPEVFLERQVALPNIVDAFGTIDVFGIHADGTPVVWDWKFGNGVQVFPEGNKQLLFYAAGAFFDPQLGPMMRNASEVELVIVQPNDRGLPLLRSHRVPIIDVFDFTVLLKQAVVAGMDAPFNPGEHCRWCPAKLICPKLTETARELPTIDRAVLADLLSLIDPLESWIKEVKDTAHELLDAGEQVPGYKLVDTHPRRVWKNPAAVIARMRGLHLDQLVTKTELLSPAQVEKALKAAKQEVPLEDLIERKSGGTVVAPESDSRPAVGGHEAALLRLAQQHAKR